MTSLSELLRLSGFAALGGGLGAANLAALRVNTALYVTRPLAAALPLHLARLTIITGVFVLLAREGAGPLLAAALGLAAVRPVALRALGGPS